MPNWKRAELRLAKLFNTKRRPLSGGNQGEEFRDDCLHPHLHLESKYTSKRTSTWNLYLKTKQLAQKENRIPVLASSLKNHNGFLLTFHSDDLLEIAQYLFKEENHVAPPSSSLPKRKSKQAKITSRKVGKLSKVSPQ